MLMVFQGVTMLLPPIDQGRCPVSQCVGGSLRAEWRLPNRGKEFSAGLHLGRENFDVPLGAARKVAGKLAVQLS
jgi:hypothetical protein